MIFQRDNLKFKQAHVGGIFPFDIHYKAKRKAHTRMTKEAQKFIERLASESAIEETPCTMQFPRIVVKNLKVLLHQDHENSTIYAPCWESLNIFVRMQLRSWSKRAHIDQAPSILFKQIFHWYFFIQELALKLLGTHKKTEGLGYYERESKAHKMVIVYILACGRERELKAFINQCNKLAKLFFANLDKESKNAIENASISNTFLYYPRTRGYFQFTLVQSAYNEVKRDNTTRVLAIL